MHCQGNCHQTESVTGQDASRLKHDAATECVGAGLSHALRRCVVGQMDGRRRHCVCRVVVILPGRRLANARRSGPTPRGRRRGGGGGHYVAGGARPRAMRPTGPGSSGVRRARPRGDAHPSCIRRSLATRHLDRPCKHHGNSTQGFRLARLAIPFPRELAASLPACAKHSPPAAIPVGTPACAHTSWPWRPSSEGRACVACRAHGRACSCHEHPTDHLKSQSP